MKKQKKRLPRHLEDLQRRADGMAAATKGRARVFKDRRKEASKKACRGKVSYE